MQNSLVKWRWPVNLSGNLKRMREARGLSISKLAIKAGMAKSYLSQLESGEQTNPSLKTILSLSVALEADVSDILSLRTKKAIRSED